MRLTGRIPASRPVTTLGLDTPEFRGSGTRTEEEVGGTHSRDGPDREETTEETRDGVRREKEKRSKGKERDEIEKGYVSSLRVGITNTNTTDTY